MGFLVAIVPIALTPGASFTLVTQRTVARQRHAAGWVIAGTATGTYCHALLAAAGLSALVTRSAEAFTVAKIIGGIYLIGLGSWTLWQTRRRRPGKRKVAPRLPWAGHHSYPQAVLANVLNPKAASVYLTLAPGVQDLSAQLVLTEDGDAPWSSGSDRPGQAGLATGRVAPDQNQTRVGAAGHAHPANPGTWARLRRGRRAIAASPTVLRTPYCGVRDRAVARTWPSEVTLLARACADSPDGVAGDHVHATSKLCRGGGVSPGQHFERPVDRERWDEARRG